MWESAPFTPSNVAIAIPVVTWVQTDWTLDTGVAASAVLDWANDRYWDGSSILSSMTTLCQNGTRDSNGLICNAGNINAIGSFLTAMKNAGGATICMEISGGDHAAAYGLLSMSSGAPDSAFVTNFPGTQAIASFNGSSLLGPTTDLTLDRYYATKYNNASLIEQASQGVITSASMNFSTITAAQFGSYNGSFFWPGRIRNCGLWTGVLADKYLKNITWPGAWNRPFYGNTGIGFFGGSNNLLASTTLGSYFNTTNPWTMVANVQAASANLGNLEVIFTNVANVGSPPWYGHESYINTNGKIRVMIFSGWAGGAATTNLIQMDGTTVLNDDKWHVIGVTYNGSGLASGIKVYIDGVAETMTPTFDNITGPTNTNIGNFNVAGQYGTFLLDFMSFIMVLDLVQPLSYFSNLMTTRTRPAADASTLVYYDFREGSGNTVFDHSGNGYDGVATAGSLAWL